MYDSHNVPLIDHLFNLLCTVNQLVLPEIFTMSVAESSSIKALHNRSQPKICTQCNKLQVSTSFHINSDICKTCVRYNSATPCSSCPTRWLNGERINNNYLTTCMECIILHCPQFRCSTCNVLCTIKNPNKPGKIRPYLGITCMYCIIMRYVQVQVISADIIDPNFNQTKFLDSGNNIIDRRPCHSCTNQLPFDSPFILCKNCIYYSYGHNQPINLPKFPNSLILQSALHRRKLIDVIKYRSSNGPNYRGRLPRGPKYSECLKVTYNPNDAEKAIIAKVNHLRFQIVQEYLISDLANIVLQNVD
jgi:hypothetical protein